MSHNPAPRPDPSASATPETGTPGTDPARTDPPVVPSAFETPAGVYNATPPRVVFGAGSMARVADELRRLGCSRALVVSTPGRAGLAGDVAARLQGLSVGVLPEAISQVPIELALRGRARTRELGADCLVSVGGGAAIGLGKGISLELGLPIVAIPTTYSGSEMTGFCGITIDGVKRMHTSLDMLARTVIYDPELLATLPAEVAAASAMNALAHCVDGIYVPTISPLLMHTAVEGARVLVEGLRQLAADPDSPEARRLLFYGAHLGGGVLAGGFALQHGLAHTLGGSFGVAHGLSHALVLPHVTAYNARFARSRIGLIEGALGVPSLGAALFDLLGDLGLPTRLQDLGITAGQVSDIARITVETDNGDNPAPVTQAAIEAITHAALEGRRPE